MIRLNDVYGIGTLGKPHGVKGEIAFSFDDEVFDRKDSDFVFVMIDGLLVPFFFEEYRFTSDVVALVKFDGIDTLEQASDLTGCEVFFKRDNADTDASVVSKAEIRGFQLVDASSGRVVGKVLSVDDSTANPLCVVDTYQGDVLIPANHELIKDIDRHALTITVDIPEGLLSL